MWWESVSRRGSSGFFFADSWSLLLPVLLYPRMTALRICTALICESWETPIVFSSTNFTIFFATSASLTIAHLHTKPHHSCHKAKVLKKLKSRNSATINYWEHSWDAIWWTTGIEESRLQKKIKFWKERSKKKSFESMKKHSQAWFCQNKLWSQVFGTQEEDSILRRKALSQVKCSSFDGGMILSEPSMYDPWRSTSLEHKRER